MVAVLVRLNRQYEAEEEELEHDAPRAAEAAPLRRHVVLVFVDRLDVASARAIQYAKTLAPDELRAIHFDLDPIRTEDLVTAWQRLGLGRLTLDVVDCPDRRLTRGAVETVAEFLVRGDTEVSVLVPELKHRRVWHRLLHDRTGESIAGALGRMAHVNVTIVPYIFGHPEETRTPALVAVGGAPNGTAAPPVGPVALQPVGPSPAFDRPVGCKGISAAEHRRADRFAGRVQALRIKSMSDVQSLEVRLTDGTGTMTVVFVGRKRIAGIKPGARLIVDGMVGQHEGRLAMFNPLYELIPQAEHELPPTEH